VNLIFHDAECLRLHLSARPVRNHISNIFAKLQVTDRSQAIIRAREVGLGREGAQGTSPRDQRVVHRFIPS
jgi:hypothetical protein